MNIIAAAKGVSKSKKSIGTTTLLSVVKNESLYHYVLQNAYFKVLPKELQITHLKDEVKYLSLFDTAKFDLLGFTDHEQVTIKATSKIFKEGEFIRIKSSKTEKSIKLKENISEKEAEEALHNARSILEKLGKETVEQQTAVYLYIPLKDLENLVLTLYKGPEQMAIKNCKAIVQQLRNNGYWCSNLEAYVQSVIDIHSIKEKQMKKVDLNVVAPLTPILTSEPGELLECDLTFLGSRFNATKAQAKILLTTICHFTKMGTITPI